MSRQDPRPRIREEALRLYEQGATPTPSLIRAALGRGSPNVIVEELRKLREERAEEVARRTGLPVAQQPLAEALQRKGLDEVLELVSDAAAAAAEMREALQAVPSLLGTIKALLTEVSDLKTEVGDARKSADEARTWFQQETAKIEARYAGVQKHALLQIEDARANSANVREELRSVLNDRGAREIGFKRQIDDLRTENIRLRTTIELLQQPRKT